MNTGSNRIPPLDTTEHNTEPYLYTSDPHNFVPNIYAYVTLPYVP